MGQHDTCDTAPGNHVNDTIAFGSMLVFASVMPPLGAEAVETDVKGALNKTGTPDGAEPSPAKKSAPGRRRHFAS